MSHGYANGSTPSLFEVAIGLWLLPRSRQFSRPTAASEAVLGAVVIDLSRSPASR